MHESLSKSPITYVLAQVRFTNIESIERYIPEIQEKIRKYFPIYNKRTIHTIELRENQQPIPSSINQWHFIDKDSVMGVLLDGKSITIHTSRYDNFNKIAERLNQILIDVNSILNISLFVRTGVRYVNVIKSNLNEYLKPALLGFSLPENKYFDPKRYLSNTELTQRSKDGVIKIKSTCVGSKDVIVDGKNLLVPIELIDVANFLSFDHFEQPKDKFLILDIDHINDKQGDFEVSKVIQNLTDLQDAVYEAFRASVTEKALADWK